MKALFAIVLVVFVAAVVMGCTTTKEVPTAAQPANPQPAAQTGSQPAAGPGQAVDTTFENGSSDVQIGEMVS